MSAEPPGSPQPTLVYTIGRVNQGIRREMRSRLATLDLSVPEYTTLSVLQRRPGLSNAQLARRALITPQSMIEVLSSLEQRDLVRRNGGKDKRVLRADLTAAGERLLSHADPLVHDIERQILADVSDADRHVILDGLLSAMTRLSAAQNLDDRGG